LNFLKLVF